MNSYFPFIDNKINYEGSKSDNLLAYRYYDPKRLVFGKTMEDILRPGVCAWHTFCWQGNDMFGSPTRTLPWATGTPIDAAKQKVDAAIEFVSKLNIPFISFHDTDVVPEGNSFKEFTENTAIMRAYIADKMTAVKLQLLLGTANLFLSPIVLAGAATNPNPEVFAYVCARVKNAMDMTHALRGQNYVLWGGREGYDTLLNTSFKRELEQLGRFVSMVVEYKHKVGFKGSLLIEPKPCEPTKHQYDHDVATVYGFLKRFNLEKEVQVNIEANHATLAGHSFEHEVAMAQALNIFGSIDANRGDPQNGWDTDQFPNSVEELSTVLYRLIKHGGFTTGGFNFDAKLRRQSIDLKDMFYAHIGGIDTLAKSLLVAEKIHKDKVLESALEWRYQGWSQKLGQEILEGNHSIDTLSNYVVANNIRPAPHSGQQELIENKINRLIWETE